MRIQVVFFDFGNTLTYMSPAPAEVAFRLFQELGFRVDLDVLTRAHQKASEFYGERWRDYRGRMREFWRMFNGFVLDSLDISDAEGVLAEAIHEGFNRPDWYHLYPDTPDALDALKSRGFRLGIISNNVDEMLVRLQQLELVRYFETITYSQEAGAEKPDPAIFRVALQRAGCAPAEAMHVGDTYEADVVGARGVGVTPVLIDRDSHYPNADCARITDLRELVDLIGQSRIPE